MAVLRKISPDWFPQENPNVAVGDIFEFPGAYEQLVAEGKVEVVEFAEDKKPDTVEN